MKTIPFFILFAGWTPLASAQSRLFDGEQYVTNELGIGSAGAQGFGVGDVDGNGTLDLVTLDGTVVLGDGHGGLGQPKPWPSNVAGLITSFQVTDVSGDGRADLIEVIDGPPPTYPATLLVRIGDGLGGFASSASYSLGSNAFPQGIAAADLDLDGDVDIVTTRQFSGTLAVFLGTGAGSFAPASMAPLLAAARTLSLADVNGDALPDLISRLEGSSAGSLGVQLGNGAGGFGSPVFLALPGTTGDREGPVRIEDVNEDGKRDLVIPVTNGTIEILLGNGLGGFGSPLVLPLGSAVTGVEVGDLDIDGHVDLVCSTSTTGQLAALRGDGTGAFGAPQHYRAGGTAPVFALGDVDGDEDLDAVVATSTRNVTLLLGDGLGGFLFAPSAEQGPVGDARRLVVRDFDADGKPDAAVLLGLNRVLFLRGNGTNGFGAPTQVLLSSTPVTGLGSSDLDADGLHDLVVVALGATASTPGTLVALRGNGAGAFVQTTATPLDLQPGFLTLTDMDFDGKPDAVVSNGGSGTISVARGNGSGGFGPASAFAAGVAQPGPIAVGDLDTDGWPDVVLRGTAGLQILRGNGTGGLLAPSTLPTSIAFGPLWLLDVDGDAHLDLVSSLAIGGVVLPGTGAGGFGAPRFLRTDRPVVQASLADVDADGIQDLCYALGNSGAGFAIGSGGGQFAATRYFGTGGDPFALELVDVNGDGLLDLVTANVPGASPPNSSGAMTVLVNRVREPRAPRPFCFGDGVGPLCPCGNPGGTARGCGNSDTVLGARLVGTGVTRMSADSFLLTCSDYVTGAGVYFRGTTVLGGGQGVPFGAGLMCTGGTIVRMGVVPADPTGPRVMTSTYPQVPPNDVPISIQGMASPGSTLYYQFLYRDPTPGLCQFATVNTPNAIEATWVP